MVRDAVDFFRAPLLFLPFDAVEDFFDDAADVFFLLVGALLLLFDEWVAAEDGELWAGKALLCSISPAKTVAVTRLNNIVKSSLTR